ncbi:MAG: hypothetical protein AAGD25_10660 [Cyanobacteria bacterium P01_F01_bin.150]
MDAETIAALNNSDISADAQAAFGGRSIVSADEHLCQQSKTTDELRAREVSRSPFADESLDLWTVDLDNFR